MTARVSVMVVLVIGLVVGSAGLVGAGEYPEPIQPVDPPAPGTVGVTGADVFAVSEDGNIVLWEQGHGFALLRQPMITDRRTGLSVPAGAAMSSPLDISGDGRYVLRSRPEPVGDGRFEQVLERVNWRTGSTRDVYRAGGWPRYALSKDISLSADGRYVGLRKDVRGPDDEVMRVSVSTGQVAVVKASDLGGEFDSFVLADGGRYGVVIVQQLDGTHVVRHDFSTGTDLTVSVLSPPQQRIPLAVSADGRFVVANGTIYDAETGSATPFVSEVTVQWTPERTVAVSTDGNRVAFLTEEALVDSDHNSRVDAYVWTRSEGSHRRVSVSDRGTELTGSTSSVVMSANGRHVAYMTGSSNVAMNLESSGIGGVVMVADLDEQVRDIGLADVARPVGGGLLTAYRSGEVSGTGGAQTYDDCNADSPITQKRKRPMLASDEVVTSISPTPGGDGYWLFTNLGRVLDCGAAVHFGDLSAITLAGEIIDSVATPTGKGYYMVGADGGVFAFGDAVYRGSVPEALPGVTLDAPIVAITVTGTNRGYRMVAADGGMFNFGDAGYFGSIPEVLPGIPLAGPVIDMVASDTGYLIVADDGGIFNFGRSSFHGSLGATAIPERIRTVLVADDLSGYVMFDRDGRSYPFGNGADLLG